MGDGADGKAETLGYLRSGEYPVFLIYDKSTGAYYSTRTEGDVKLSKDVCRNGYPYCYGWENFGNYFDGALMIRAEVDSANAVVGIDNKNVEIPGSFGLSQNYPNPFNI